MQKMLIEADCISRMWLSLWFIKMILIIFASPDFDRSFFWKCHWKQASKQAEDCLCVNHYFNFPQRINRLFYDDLFSAFAGKAKIY